MDTRLPARYARGRVGLRSVPDSQPSAGGLVMRLKKSVTSTWQSARKKLPLALGWLQQLSGRVPMGGKAPLTEKEFARIWDGPQHSIADYLPWVDFDDELKVFELNDGVSVGAVFEVRQVNIE